MTSPSPIDSFISRWAASSAAERGNYQMFLSELCDLLGVQRPDPKGPITELNVYCFDRDITFQIPDGTTHPGWIDLYKRGHFVLETKQGSEKASAGGNGLFPEVKKKRKRGTATRGTQGWDEAMIAARGQAENYVRALPPAEGNPPFIVVVDIGYSFELYSDFSRAGKIYLPFPDARNHRFMLDDLRKPEVQQTLRTLWTDPMALDPSRRTAKVTRLVAERLARLAKSLESSGHAPEIAAAFLMRCLFTMFAEDVQLIPERSFTGMLEDLLARDEVAIFPDMARSLWETMNAGGFSSILHRRVLQFNGGLFQDPQALPLTVDQLELLIDAGRADWRDVEPAIFGTLLERALDPIERHKLGAHYTPRAYVERLVMPTIVEPLREEWDTVRGAALTLQRTGETAAAIRELREFHNQLCTTRVLDPACGSGNFLYVTLEHMKRLEGEVLEMLEQLGKNVHTLEFTELTVDPHQFLGIEINPRAAAIAEMVLWIGYLQWHFRTHGDTLPREPVLHAYHNIECRDAVLAYDRTEPLLDDAGRPVTRWDGRTYKKHPVTGEDVPDDTARVPVLRYVNPRKAEWPEAEYIVGNPPFIGNSKMRIALGDGYVDTLRATYKDVPEGGDYVMYWWNFAAEQIRSRKSIRFGFITTNSIRQKLNRGTIEKYLTAQDKLSLLYAIPDHPWVDSSDGADVRISMTVVEAGDQPGRLESIVGADGERSESDEILLSEKIGYIHADLTVGAAVINSVPLQANSKVCFQGVKLHGKGFVITPDEALRLGINRIPSLNNHIRAYRNGRDLTQTSRNVMVIDLFGMTAEQTRIKYPEVFQWLYERVKPERDQNNRASRRDNWWIFGEPISTHRPALKNLSKYIATAETSKHVAFMFLDGSILPDVTIVSIATSDAFLLGVLSSRIHVKWAFASGGRMGIGNDQRYTKSRCFETFPFPDATEDQKEHIRQLAEQLDAHRKRQQSRHPKLTITDMYNVLEKLRSDDPLSEKEKVIHEQGLVSVLKQIHDELDAAVFDAYGWPATLTDEEILERLVALNAERAAEERAGTIRWLRPEYQNPKGTATQTTMVIEEEVETAVAIAPAVKAAKVAWPKPLKEQLQAVRSALAAQATASTADQVAKTFKGARVDRVAEILDSLSALGQVREVEEGRFVV